MTWIVPFLLGASAIAMAQKGEVWWALVVAACAGFTAGVEFLQAARKI
jgi:hypothetical protein